MYVLLPSGVTWDCRTPSSLWVKAPKGADGFTLRLIDGTGQCHQLPLRIAPSGEWQRIGFSGWFSGPHSKDLDHVGDLILE